MKIRYLALLLFLIVAPGQFTRAQVAIDIKLKTKKYIGNVSDLTRARYFNLHHSYTSWELNGGNDAIILDGLGVGYGRAFGGPGSGNPNKDPKDTVSGKITAFPSIDEGDSIGKAKLDVWDNNPTFHTRATDEIIITDKPQKGFLYNGDFDAGAAYSSAYLQAAFSNKMPKYFEMLNEPFVHTKKFAPYSQKDQVISQMITLWKKTADKIHQDIPELKVGGTAPAWPEMENDDFNHWKSQMKHFMDSAGGSMDFFSTHLYDGENKTGGDQNRSGSNAEAILDLIEAYSYHKWQRVKPQVISEYGKTVQSWIKNADKKEEPKPYSEARDGEILKSVNAFLMQFLDKPDRIDKSVPFITAKSGFYYNEKNPNQYPYPWVLLRKDGNGGYVFTHLKKLYELWKDVKGHRTQVNTGDPDILAHTFVDSSRAYVALYNMEDVAKTVNLNFPDSSDTIISSITLRRLSYDDVSGIPDLNIASQSLPSSLTLKGGETIVMVCHLNGTIPSQDILREKNYYSLSKKKHFPSEEEHFVTKIEANTDLSYTFNEVTTGVGKASLRLGLGRDHDIHSLSPEVKVNGVAVSVPSDWMGDDQKGRNRFFGVIEIPVSMHLLEKNNTITIKFPDNGGHVSSAILNVERIDGSRKDSISLARAPLSLDVKDTSLSVNVDYYANGQKELVVEFWKGNTWLKNSPVVPVSVGSGTQTMTVTVDTLLAEGTDYLWKAHIRPVGANWQSATDTDHVNNVVVEIKDNVSLENAPTTAVSQTSYTVDVVYASNGNKELVLELWKGATWLKGTIAQVAHGTGVLPMTVNLDSAPSAGSDYKWKAYTRPVGGTWMDSTSWARIDGVLITDPPINVANFGFEMGNLTGWNKSWGHKEVINNEMNHVYSGSHSVKVTGMGSVSQVITGLSPNTSYTLKAYGKVAGTGQRVFLGVKGHGNAETSIQITSTSYTQGSVSFTTGAADTNAQIYFHAGNTGHIAYGDDFEVAVNPGARTERPSDHHQFRIYPNPSSGRISLRLPGIPLKGHLVIYSLEGKQVMWQDLSQFAERKISLDLTAESQRNKLLILKLQLGERTYIEKLFFQK